LKPNWRKRLSDDHQRDQAIDFVVIGFDTSLKYEKLDIACDYLRRETRWLAANPDLVCPMPDDRVLPDCGSIIAFLTACIRPPA
jgi:ribonucleotide monophosphatase NagD (HAD superfamily)